MGATNTKIELMTQNRTLSVVVTAYAYAALIVAGPWIFTMFGIAGLSSVQCASGCTQIPLFRTIVIYNSLFSLIVTAPLAFFVGRYVSDRMSLNHPEGVYSTFVISLVVFLLVTAATIVPFYFMVVELDPPARFAAAQNALLIGASWLLIPFLGAVRADISLLVAFSLNALALAVLGALLDDPSATVLLTAFNTGFAITDVILVFTLVRQFGGDVGFEGDFLASLKLRWELPVAGFAYAFGVWADKAVMWFGVGDGVLITAGVLRTMPNYDTAMFWAQLVSIPVIAVAFVHVQTRFELLFEMFFGRLGDHASLRELTVAMQKLQGFVIAGVVTLFVSLAIVAASVIMYSMVFMTELGLRPSYMSILRVAACAAVFYGTAMFCFVVLLYFDLRRQALLVVGTYAVVNPLLTVAFLPLGQAYYGYGCLIAAAAALVIGFITLLRELPWLNYHAFVTNNTSLGVTADCG